MPASTLSIFKDKLGRYRSKSLFIEYEHPDYPAIFTLAEEDREKDGTTYISAKRKYLEHQDPTEHKFAQSCFGSYKCWQAVCASPDLRIHIEEWRAELELLLRSIGHEALVKQAQSGNTQAAKALATISTAKTREPGTRHSSAGRPRKTGDGPSPSDLAAHHKEAYDRLFAQSPSPIESEVVPSDNEHEVLN